MESTFHSANSCMAARLIRVVPVRPKGVSGRFIGRWLIPSFSILANDEPTTRNGRTTGECRSALDWFHIKHFVRGAEAIAFVEGPTSIRGVQGDNPDAATACFGECQLDQVAGDVFSAVLRLDIDIQQITAVAGGGVQRVWRPVQNHQSAAADDIAGITECEPAEIFAGLKLLRNPWLEMLCHHIEDAVVGSSCIHEHAPAMAGDDGGIGSGRSTGFEHVCEYRAEVALPVHWCPMTEPPPQLDWERDFFRPGERLCIAVSGGADSVGLLVAMADSRRESGLVLSGIHVHHGLRGAEADADVAFVVELARQLDVPLRVERGDAGALAAERGNGIEEAARVLRYGFFRELLQRNEADAIATAHTMDDQAETVLMKLLRGAWTEGLSGVAPVVQVEGGGRIVRPLLGVTHADAVRFLERRGHGWRQDSSNRELTFTRNRVRYNLLPQMREFQPRVAEVLSRMAAVARDEEAWWKQELARVMPGVVLPGKPVRGGGRSASTRPGESSVAVELERLRGLHPALRRRVLRAAAEQMGCALTFEQVEAILDLVKPNDGAAGKRGRVELGSSLTAERSIREIRLVRSLSQVSKPLAEMEMPVPGTVVVEEYGFRVMTEGGLPTGETLVLRTPRPGDRVRLAHSGSVKTVKEVLERQGLSAAERRNWPVIAVGSSILWMRGVDVEWTPGLQIAVEPLREMEPTPGTAT